MYVLLNLTSRQLIFNSGAANSHTPMPEASRLAVRASPRDPSVVWLTVRASPRDPSVVRLTVRASPRDPSVVWLTVRASPRDPSVVWLTVRASPRDPSVVRLTVRASPRDPSVVWLTVRASPTDPSVVVSGPGSYIDYVRRASTCIWSRVSGQIKKSAIPVSLLDGPNILSRVWSLVIQLDNRLLLPCT